MGEEKKISKFDSKRVESFFNGKNVSDSQIEAVLNMLADNFGEILGDYLRGKKYNLIAKEHEIKLKELDTIIYKSKYNINNNLQVYIALDELDSGVKIDFKNEIKHYAAILSYRQRLLDKIKENKLNIKSEVLPCLSSDRLNTFNYIVNISDQSLSKEASSVGSVHASMFSRRIESLFEYVDKIAQKKRDREKFIRSFGGQQMLENIELAMNKEQLKVFTEVVISINPEAKINFRERYGYEPNLISVERVIRDVLQKREDAKEFIEKNGGEDFLIYEFGSTLDDKQFSVLSNVLMDYNYKTLRGVSEELGESANYVALAIPRILKKLENYKKRKSEVDAKIEAAGGAQRVLDEIYLKLNERERVIFEQRILAYHQSTMDEICQELNVSDLFVRDKERALNGRLEEMIKSSQRQ